MVGFLFVSKPVKSFFSFVARIMGIRSSTQDLTQGDNDTKKEAETKLKKMITKSIYKAIKEVMLRMHHDVTGVPYHVGMEFGRIFPSVFTGSDLIIWIMDNMSINDREDALYLANIFCSHGFLFPVNNHYMRVTDDEHLYRFQPQCFWPLSKPEASDYDYAVHLCKRDIESKIGSDLAYYEAERLEKLREEFRLNWIFIKMQAEAEIKVTLQLHDKIDEEILDSQERGFWDLHRPMPGVRVKEEFDYEKLKKFDIFSNIIPAKETLSEHNMCLVDYQFFVAR